MKKTSVALKWLTILIFLYGGLLLYAELLSNLVFGEIDLSDVPVEFVLG